MKLVTAIVGLSVCVVACANNATTSEPASAVTEPSTSMEASSISIAGIDALVWGSGKDGVVLAPGAIYDAASWTEQAEQISAEGMVVVSLKARSGDDILAAMSYLQDEHGISQVALVGASAGTAPVFSAAQSNPGGVRQLMVLAGSGDASSLGEFPKLFASSEGDTGSAAAAERMVADAPGDQNELLLLPGSAHAQAIFTTDQGPVLLEQMIAWLNRYRQAE